MRWRAAGPLVWLAWCLPLAVALILLVCLLPIWREVSADLEREVRGALTEESLALHAEYLRLGRAGLVERLGDRSARSMDRDALYLLTDREGRALAGNLSAWPAGLPFQDGDSFSLAATDSGGAIEGRQFVLEDGEHLLIARRSPIAEFQLHLRRRLLIAGICVVAGCGLIGGLTIVLYRRRLQGLHQGAHRIRHGELSQRLPVTAAGDELDGLAVEFNATFSDLQQLVEGAREVGSALAHDMRRPIAALRYQLDDLLRHPDLPTTLAPTVAAALASTDDALATFAALLRLARIESGRHGIRLQDTDLQAVLAELADTYAAVAQAQGVELRCELTPVQLAGDADLLFQLGQNLLENALCYGAGPVDLTLQQTAHQIQLRVRDHGPGVPPDTLARLFDRYYRVDPARGGAGNGIGLALVRAITTLHGGTASASLANPGLCVTVRLPRSGSAIGKPT